MEALFFGFVTAVFAAFSAIAVRFGVDSRIDSSDRRAPVKGLTV